MLLRFISIALFTGVAHAGNDLSNLLTDLEEMRNAGNVPILAVSLFRDGAIEHSSVLGRGTLDTPLRWGSITKTFTALALSAAVRESEHEWETPVAALGVPLPWDNPWTDSHPVRFRDLATLCAGMTDLSAAEFNDNEPRPLAEVLKKRRSIHWPPGLQHSYTNVTPGLSAWAVEQLSGHTFSDFLRKTVFTPLGMTQSSLQPVDGLPGGFKSDGLTEIPYWHMTFPAAGGLNASLREMTQAVLILLNDGRLPAEDTRFLPKEETLPDEDTRFSDLPSDEDTRSSDLTETLSHEDTRSFDLTKGMQVIPQYSMEKLWDEGCLEDARTSLPIGYGAGAYGRVRRGFIFHGHGGDADGYRSRYSLLREKRRGYVVLINADNPQLLRRMEARIENYLVADLEVGVQIGTDPTIDVTRWLGTYYPSTARFGLNGWQQGERDLLQVLKGKQGLMVRRNDRVTRLLTVDKQRFRREGDPRATVRFILDGKATYLQGELGQYVRLDEHCPDWLNACELSP